MVFGAGGLTIMKETPAQPLDVVIIGAGPAGLTAAIYAARGGLSTVIMESAGPGGKAALTDRIDNYPGFPDGASGPELMNGFYQQAVNVGAQVFFEEVRDVSLDEEIKKVRTPERELLTKTVIVASGSRQRPLGIEGEDTFQGRGVSNCATCDGAFFREKVVVVIGGGKAALVEAIFLSKFASEVIVVHRRNEFRASPALVQEAEKNPKITFRMNLIPRRILGETKVTGVDLERVSDGSPVHIECSGVFVLIGSTAGANFAAAGLEIDASGYIKTDATMRTNISGVYAAGDIRDTVLRQVATAVGDGAIAAVEVEKYLMKLGKENGL
jgi:thioredoxin reductase (NADPH)